MNLTLVVVQTRTTNYWILVLGLRVWGLAFWGVGFPKKHPGGLLHLLAELCQLRVHRRARKVRDADGIASDTLKTASCRVRSGLRSGKHNQELYKGG